MLLYCVRHGEARSNVEHYFPDETDPPTLTDRGVSQAQEVADRLRGLGIQAIYASPILRTRLTAEKISITLGIPYKVDVRLREIGLGTLAGKPYPEVRSRDPEWYHEYFDESNRYGLEKFSEVVTRTSEAVTDAFKSGFKSVVFVSHVEPIRAIIAAAVGNIGEWVRRVRISNTSITVISVTNGQSRLLAVNWLPLREYSEV